jgi:hypothetical protein
MDGRHTKADSSIMRLGNGASYGLMVHRESIPFLPCQSPPTRLKPYALKMEADGIAAGSRKGRFGDLLDDGIYQPSGKLLALHGGRPDDIAKFECCFETRNWCTGRFEFALTMATPGPARLRLPRCNGRSSPENSHAASTLQACQKVIDGAFDRLAFHDEPSNGALIFGVEIIEVSRPGINFSSHKFLSIPRGRLQAEAVFLIASRDVV